MRCAIHQRVMRLCIGDFLFVRDVDDNVVFARGPMSFIHTFLVGELIRPREGGRSRVERKHVSIGWAEVCCTEAKFAFLRRVSTPICSALERRVSRKQKNLQAALLFLLFPLIFFYRKKGNSRAASFGLFYTPSNWTAYNVEKKFNREFIIKIYKFYLSNIATNHLAYELFRIARTLKFITKRNCFHVIINKHCERKSQ